MLNATLELDDFHRARDKSIERLQVVTAGAVRDAGVEGRAQAQRGKFRDHTGNLRRNIFSRFLGQSDGAWWSQIVATMPYARFVEEGTGPHDIWPKEGHGFVGPMRAGQSRRSLTDIGTHRVALRWYVGGRPVFARMVHHPGSRAYPFMGPALLKSERVLIRELESGFVTVEALWT